jgi:hypothetical protein
MHSPDVQPGSERRSDRVNVVLKAATRAERDPDKRVLELLERHADDIEGIARQLVADEDPDRIT